MSTPYHAAYYATELTKRNSSDDIAKLGASLFSAHVDLNPHQLDAALFAFRSPLSRGAILADEVGLGKTIEAGLVISQLWAEHKRRVLIITPTILRKQWAQELTEKFFITPIVLDSKAYNARKKSTFDQPLDIPGKCVICSYHFARAHNAEIASIPWDLIVIDEAHRLRNVFKPGNKIAKAIKLAVANRPLLLLTATPLQNSLLELYGLISFLDEHLFGSIDAFRARYMRGPMADRELAELARRLRPICQRTLRRQVQEYVRFTNRIPITQDFTLSTAEQELYDNISDYLQRPTLNALPNSQRALMTLVLRKLLASSSYAIAGTLSSLAGRLQSRLTVEPESLDDFDALEEMTEDWNDSKDDKQKDGDSPELETETASSNESISLEIEDLTSYGELAKSITTNAKGEALLTALQHGFAKLRELGANTNAVIFTESRRTQTYLYDLLTSNGYEGRTLTINGTNTDDRAGTIYKNWVTRHSGEEIVTGNKTVDLRAALVEHFRDHADILIATEAAAEGVNLQFCSLVVNYDLPWNPQRIEQRIGRCHRYGQKHDVVVINFVNRSNAADLRVFELLSEKFRLFDGVFGSSDEVLGALESGVDFERRIAEIYQSCRSSEMIDAAFAQLQMELDLQIQERMAATRTALIENFDEEVHQRLKISREQSMEFLDRIQQAFWNLTHFELKDIAEFDDSTCHFILENVKDSWSDVPVGEYQFILPAQNHTHGYAYRLSSPLASHIIHQALERKLEPACVIFDLSGYKRKIGLLEPLAGCTGWMQVSVLAVASLEAEDRLLFALIDNEGNLLEQEVGEKLFRLNGTMKEIDGQLSSVEETLNMRTASLKMMTLNDISQRNSRYFDEEITKLDRWADDLKHGLETEIKDIQAKVNQIKKEARTAPDLKSKLDLQHQVKELEVLRNRKRRELFDAEDEIDSRKETLISSVEARLQQEINIKPLFTIQWELV